MSDEKPLRSYKSLDARNWRSRAPSAGLTSRRSPGCASTAWVSKNGRATSGTARHFCLWCRQGRRNNYCIRLT